ncbi:unnamed protein product [Prorocentrum cordatum]|uniref:CSN8/PSMD8/EIF3K domain-containing protein n=1 Tax=Prorocentrum cordatum TaxID=2364126 RepID=A0ABN9Y4P0_9DINO|nr:unnamed protein product [Polarella glacialis]
MSPEEMGKLLSGKERYSADSVAPLEACLEDQLKTGSYSLDANLALLKLYLLFPDMTNKEIVEGILLKALMAFPATDFSLCMYLIPEKFHEELKSVTELASELELAKFKSFWKKTESVEGLKKAAGFQMAGCHPQLHCRRHLLDVPLCQERPGRRLAEPACRRAGCDGEGDQGWSRTKDDKNTLIVNTEKFESKRLAEAKASQEPKRIGMDQYRKLFAAATSA